MKTKTAISNGIKATGLMLVFLLFAPAQAHAAAALNWICGDGQWDTASCWSEGMPPEYGDNVFVTDWSIGGATIDYISAADPMLNYLEIGNGSSGANTLTQSQDTLTTDYMTIGYLYYDLGYYELSDPGNLNVNYLLTVGAEGVGYISQFDGTNTVGDNLVLGDQAGGTGYYDLSGGDLSANDLHIGEYGTGEFTQSGGTNTIASELFLGRQNGSLGSYTLNDGTLTADVERIGIEDGSTGTFTQNGGTNTANGLTLGAVSGSNGTYNFFGGTLTDSLIVGDAGTGIFNNSGGTHNVTDNLTLGNQSTGNGTYNLSDTGILDVTGDGDSFIGNNGVGYWRDQQHTGPLYRKGKRQRHL